MRGNVISALGLLALTACSGQSGSDSPASDAASDAAAAMSDAAPALTPVPVRADLARCERYKIEEGEMERQRTKPLAFPAAFKDIVATDRDHVAVATLDGGTVCIDARWQDSIHHTALSKDGRLLGYGWDGYEAFGYQLIDRAGKGQVIETGTAPLSSPSGRRLASIDWSESGFGGLNGFGVWEVQPGTVKRLALISDNLPPGDWRLLEWSGENCVGLTLLPIDAVPNEDGSLSRVPRDFWFASAANHWKPEAGTCPKK